MSAYYPYFEIPYPPCITNPPTPLAFLIDLDAGSSPAPSPSKFSKHFSYFFNALVLNIKDLSSSDGLPPTIDANVSQHFSSTDKHLIYTCNSSAANDTFKGGRLVGMTLDQVTEDRYPTKRKFLPPSIGRPASLASSSLSSAAASSLSDAPPPDAGRGYNEGGGEQLANSAGGGGGGSRIASMPNVRTSVFVPSRPFSLGGSAGGQSGTSSSSSSVVSLLPSTWLPKHLSLLPSYIFVVASFSADASLSEWSRSLSAIVAAVDKLRATGTGRENKIHLVVLKRGQGTAPWGDNVAGGSDVRLSAGAGVAFVGGSAATGAASSGGFDAPTVGGGAATAMLDPQAYKQVESDRLGILRQKCGLTASLFTTINLATSGAVGGNNFAAGSNSGSHAGSSLGGNSAAAADSTSPDAPFEGVGGASQLHKELKRLYGALKTGSSQYYLAYARKLKKKNATLLEAAGSRGPPATSSAGTALLALAATQAASTANQIAMGGGKTSTTSKDDGVGGVGWGGAHVGTGMEAARMLADGARFCFKVAIFYEMLQNRDKATRYYVECYAAIAALYRLVAANAAGPHKDLGHQCRGLGEWTHYKLYKAALESAASAFAASIRPPPAGQPASQAATIAQQQMSDSLLQAAEQWTRHSALFLSSYWSEGSVGGGSLPSNPRFCFHSFVARQRLVAAILCERHAPRGGEGLEPSARGSVEMFLSGHRHYAAVAEALLEAGRDLQRTIKEGVGGGIESSTPPFRCKEGSAPAPINPWVAVPGVFVGGFPRGGLPQILSEEAARDHGILASAYVDKALTLLEQGRQGRREPNELLLCARLHLIKSGVHEDRGEFQRTVETATRALAIARGAVLPHSVTATADASVNKGGVNAAAAPPPQLLQAPPVNNVDCSWPLVSLQARARILRGCEALGDAGGARLAALELLLLPSGGFLSGALLNKVVELAMGGWGKKSAATAPLPPLPASLPTFANTRDSPVSFYVTFPGITHAVAGDTVIARLVIKSNVAPPQLTLRISSLVLRFNFATVTLPAATAESPIELAPKTERVFNVAVPLPATLVGGRRGSMSVVTTPQKGAFADSAAQKVEKPNSVGFTRAGGACFPMRPGELAVGAHAVDDVAAEVLNGVPVSCRGLTCTLDNGVVIAVEDRGGRGSGGSVQNDEDGTARIREDFLVHSWAGNTVAGVSHGPRCLRVVQATPKLEITDLTSAVTGGRAMDGVVHRVVFKVQAGAVEECRDLAMELSCANTFASAENPAIKKWNRPAIFVTTRAEDQDVRSSEAYVSYNIPSPWKPLGIDGMGVRAPIKIKSLSPGESTYVAVHLFRACPNKPTVAGSPSFLGEADADACKTEFECVFTYNQVIHGGAVKEVRRRHVASVAWGESLCASLQLSALRPFPSGLSHRSNAAREREDNAGLFVPVELDPSSSAALKPCAVSGEPVKVRCTMYSSMPSSNLGVSLKRVSFQESLDDDAVDVKFVGSDAAAASQQQRQQPSQSDNGIVLYAASGDSRFSSLVADSKIGLSFVVTPKIKQPAATGAKAVEAALGGFNVWWEPLPIALPPGVTAFNEAIESGLHGPLPSAACLALQFLGPAAVVEEAPFKVELIGEKSECDVAKPFKVTYKITNKTPLHQHLAIEVEDCVDKSFLVGGVKVGSFKMNPNETRFMEFDMVFFQPGKRKMPAVSLVSLRHQSYVIGGGDAVVSLPFTIWVNPR